MYCEESADMQTLESGIGVEGCFLASTVNLEIYGRECREQSGLSAKSSSKRKSQSYELNKFVRFADLPKMWQFADLRFVSPMLHFI